MINGIRLIHINDTQRCGAQFPANVYDNFGCGYDNNKLFTESVFHLVNNNVHELWYPTGQNTNGFSNKLIVYKNYIYNYKHAFDPCRNSIRILHI